jgi:hypothetical protein
MQEVGGAENWEFESVVFEDVSGFLKGRAVARGLGDWLIPWRGDGGGARQS